MSEPQPSPAVLADALHPAGREAVRGGEVLETEAVEAGDTAAGTKPDEVIRILVNEALSPSFDPYCSK
jgi:hypothetical protein